MRALPYWWTLTEMGHWRSGEEGQRVPLSASAAAAVAVHEAIHSQQVGELSAEDLGSIRYGVDDLSNTPRGGFDALPVFLEPGVRVLRERQPLRPPIALPLDARGARAPPPLPCV